jgi:anti-sigma B factor antagonist
MQITVKTENKVKVLEFSGNLDTQTFSDARDQLIEMIENGETKILANFEKLEYISSAGLRALLIAAKQLNLIGGEIRICCLNGVVKEVFNISGFETIFKVFGSEPEALDGF